MNAPVYQENIERTVTDQPLGLKLPAQFFSILFHPLFIPLYVTAFLLYIHPTAFAGFSDEQKVRIIGIVAVNIILLPGATVFLLWRLKFSQSILLKTQRERIIPYAATMFFSFWCWNVFRNLSFSPAVFNDFLLGVFITVIIGWMCNIYYKVSMHALGVGGMLCFIILISLSGEGSAGLYIAAASLITAITLSARFIVSNHTSFDVYSGLFLGAIAQLIAKAI